MITAFLATTVLIYCIYILYHDEQNISHNWLILSMSMAVYLVILITIWKFQTERELRSLRDEYSLILEARDSALPVIPAVCSNKHISPESIIEYITSYVFLQSATTRYNVDLNNLLDLRKDPFSYYLGRGIFVPEYIETRSYISISNVSCTHESNTDILLME